MITSAFNGKWMAAGPTSFVAGTGGNPDIGPLYSWVYDILPYIGSDTLYNDYRKERVYLDNGTRTGDDPTRPPT